MFSILVSPYYKLKGLLFDYKQPILYTTGTATAVLLYLGYKKYKPLIISLRNDLHMMNKLASDMYSSDQSAKQYQLIQRYIHNCNVSDLTLKNFAQQTRLDLTNKFDVDSIRNKLTANKQSATATVESQSSSTVQHDITLWNEFAIASYARIVSTIYCIALLNVLIKVQLSIVSRYVVTDNLQSTTSQLPSIPGLTAGNPSTLHSTPLPSNIPLPASTLEELNKHYFSLTAHLQSTGLQLLTQIINTIVTQQLSHRQLTDRLTYSQLCELFDKIKQQVDVDAGSYNFTINNEPQQPNTPFISYLFPSDTDLAVLLSHMTFSDNKHSATATQRLKEMTHETKMILNSTDFVNSLYESIQIGFTTLYAQLELNTFSDTTTQITFASSITKMIKLFNIILPAGEMDSSPLLQGLSMQPQLISVPPPNTLAASTSTPTLQYTLLQQMCQVIFFPLNQLVVLQNKLNETYINTQQQAQLQLHQQSTLHSRSAQLELMS